MYRSVHIYLSIVCDGAVHMSACVCLVYTSVPMCQCMCGMYVYVHKGGI